MGHVPGALDGICFICHRQIHVQDANIQYRTGRPPRQHMAGRHPHWTQEPSLALVAADAEDGDSDDAEWLMSIHGQPDSSREDRDTTSAHAAAQCVICHNGPSRWQDHRLPGRTCSTCASDRGLGPFAIPRPPRRQQQHTRGHATGSTGSPQWTSWHGMTTSAVEDEVGRQVGGRYSIKELERRIDFNDGKAYVWEEVRDYYTSRGWSVYQARDHWNALKLARPHFLVWPPSGGGSAGGIFPSPGRMGAPRIET